MLSLVVLPPQEEQKRIIAKVDQLLVLCDSLDARIGEVQAMSVPWLTQSWGRRPLSRPARDD